MLFRGDLQGEPKPVGRMGAVRRVSLARLPWPMRSRIFPPQGAACFLSRCLREHEAHRNRSSLAGFRTNGPVIHLFRTRQVFSEMHKE